MGKKRIIKKSAEELIKERERIEKSVRKEVKAGKQKVEEGKIFIASSYNNTLITLTNLQGDVLFWKSAGSIGFKGTKKGTAFAASKVAATFAEALKRFGVKQTTVLVKGIGSGRDSALRSLANRGVNIISIKDVTSIPHNGCRPKKPRRV